MNLNDDLREKLEELAMNTTDNFCYACYEVVTGDHCPKCGTDDFMRHLDGVGVEYGTEWVIERLIGEHCTPIDEEEAYEDLLNECYGQVEICGMKYDPGYALKTIDPIAFRCGVSDMLADDDTYIEVDGQYYLVSDIEAMIEELS